MSPKLEQISAMALELSESERGELASRLIKSLDAPFDDVALVEQEWQMEISRRLKEVEDGTVKPIPAEVVFRELRDELSKITPRPNE